jgi:probable phosphoglycerate mutase
VTPTTVFFVRHASHDRLAHMLCGRMAGIGLREAGRVEAARLAKRLGAADLAAVYSSPLDRARETAEPIAAAAGRPVQISEALNELDYGAWSGRRWDDLEADPDWVAWNRDRPHRRLPGGETLLELQNRMAGWLHEMRERHPGERVAAVSHAEPIKAALLWVLGATLDALGRFEVRPASVSVVVAGEWGFKVDSINAPVIDEVVR